MPDKELDVCPLCNEQLSQFSRGRTLHANSHNITAEQLALLLDPSEHTCKCGCGKKTQWKGWKLGFASMLQGHMSKEARVSGIKKLKLALIDKHWSRGLTKETSEIIASSGKKSSKTLKEKYSAGLITHWSKGKTASDDQRIADAAKKRSETLQKNHPNFMDRETIILRINKSLGDRFQIVTGLEGIEERKNNTSYFVTLKCNKCDRVSECSIYSIIHADVKQCSACYEAQSSRAQDEIDEYIKSLIGKEFVKCSDRTNATGYELDVYVPSRSFAVEYNGLYWHSEHVQRDKTYHDKKSVACANTGIRLLHVFEDEWRNKKDIVMSMIKNRLTLSTRLGARTCKIIEMSRTDSAAFFERNHIDGNVQGFKTYGLMTKNGDIACAIKLRSPHSKKWKKTIEIARFASAIGTNVIGGYSRLLKHVIKNHQGTVISYVDTRFGGDGEHCIAAGMQLVHKTTPNFWWTDKVSRFNRLQCKAKNGMSEKENAAKMKLVKIWGCSNLLFST